jgi:hypothetical protein
MILKIFYCTKDIIEKILHKKSWEDLRQELFIENNPVHRQNILQCANNGLHLMKCLMNTRM